MTTSATPENSGVLKNILIGLTTTVIGATIIYFLGFNNKKDSFSKEEQADITGEAWKTYITVENIYTKSSASLLRDLIKLGETAEALQQTRKESEKLQSSLNDLIATSGLDKEMISLLKRRLENEQKEWPATEKFFKGLDELAIKGNKENRTRQETQDSLARRVTNFTEQLKKMLDRPVNDIEELSKKLSAKYDQPFSAEGFLIVQAVKYKKDIFNLVETDQQIQKAPPVQPVKEGKDKGNIMGEPANATKQYLTGKWSTDGAIITLSANGQSTWFIPSTNTEAKGNWQLKNNQLVLNIKRHPVTGKYAVWIFDISNVMTNACIITKTTTPFNTYNLVRQ